MLRYNFHEGINHEFSAMCAETLSHLKHKHWPVELWRNIFDKDIGWPDAMYKYGIHCIMITKDFDQAIRILIELHEQWPRYKTSRVCFFIHRALSEIEKPDESYHWICQAQKANHKKFPIIYLYCARLESFLGYLNKARNNLRYCIDHIDLMRGDQRKYEVLDEYSKVLEASAFDAKEK